jgi:hypothetical protein
VRSKEAKEAHLADFMAVQQATAGQMERQQSAAAADMHSATAELKQQLGALQQKVEGAAETARVAALAATASRWAQEVAQKACVRSSGKIDTLQDLLSC